MNPQRGAIVMAGIVLPLRPGSANTMRIQCEYDSNIVPIRCEYGDPSADGASGTSGTYVQEVPIACLV